MPFRPHTLPFKLRRAIDSGVCSVQDISRASGVSIRAIEQIMKGAKPGPQTTHQLGKVLSHYGRQEHGHLRLAEELEDDPNVVPPQYTRGVKEDLDAYDGTRGFTMRNRVGKKIFHCAMPAGTPEQSLTDFLESWLEELDPIIHLEPSSAEPTSSA